VSASRASACRAGFAAAVLLVEDESLCEAVEEVTVDPLFVVDVAVAADDVVALLAVLDVVGDGVIERVVVVVRPADWVAVDPPPQPATKAMATMATDAGTILVARIGRSD
jgi:hypothetical protein